MATGWRRRGTGPYDSRPGLRAKARRSGLACYRKESLPAAGWRKEYWKSATYTKSETLPLLEPSLVLKRSPRCKKMNLATHKFINRRSWKSKTDVLEAGLSCAPAGRMLERI